VYEKHASKLKGINLVLSLKKKYLCTPIVKLKYTFMKSYETVFILTPVLSEDQAKEAVKKFESEIKSFGAKLKHSESWGLKKLAYPIQKKSTGFYFLFEFEAENNVVADMELLMKRDERVLRFLTVKMDADHLTYAESRRQKSKKAQTTEA
jgi:small subunit ribosomal protein S6